MAFTFKKQSTETVEPRVVMAVEMADGDNVSRFKYTVPRLKRSHVISAQFEARRVSKGAKSEEAQAMASADLISTLLEGARPIDGAPELNTLLEYLGDDNIEPFLAEMFRLATEDYDTLRAEGVEVQ